MSTKKATEHVPASTLAVYDRVIAGLQDVERKGATLPYTSINGHMFSFIGQDGSISLRLPADARDEVIKKYKTVLSEQHGVVMNEYVTVPARLLNDEAALSTYFKTSYEYVKTLKPKPTKKATTTQSPKPKK